MCSTRATFLSSLRTKAQLVFTDPPYNVAIAGNVSGLGKSKYREFAMASGEMSSESSPNSSRPRLLALRIQHRRFDSLRLHRLAAHPRALRRRLKAYSELKNLCVWSKTNGGMGSLYRSEHELVFVFKNGTAPHINNVELGRFGRNRTNVWTYAGQTSFGSDRKHRACHAPDGQAGALVADAILDCSNRDGIILDGFAGSGTR